MFEELIKILNGNDPVYLQDFSDRMSSTITASILFVMSTLIAYRTYFISPMDCYSSTSPSGHNFDNYVTSYCWVDGTTVFDKQLPEDKDWDSPEFININYYPWIPIILGIQCAFFYLPKLLWKEYCLSKAGTDLQNVIAMAIRASKASITARQESLKDIAGIIEALFHLHRDNRHGIVSQAKRKISQTLPLFVWGKRSGNEIFGFYLMIKFLYIINAIGQLFLMAKVLQLDNSFWSVFYQVFNFLFHGYAWKATKYFPRTTFCKVKGVRSLGVMENHYIAQCVLPINILNEKVYIFLFLWMIFVIIFSSLYIMKWLYVMAFWSPKRKLVKIYLKGKYLYKNMDEAYIDKFITEFIRLDGIFLLKMIRIHCGDVLTAGIIEQLWTIYKNKYRGVDLSNPECSSQCENLALRLEPGELKASMKTKQYAPSAPKSDNLTGFL